MGKTISEKIIGEHVDKEVSAGDFVVAKVDLCLLQDGTGPLVDPHLASDPFDIKLFYLFQPRCIEEHNSRSFVLVGHSRFDKSE